MSCWESDVAYIVNKEREEADRLLRFLSEAEGSHDKPPLITAQSQRDGASPTGHP